MADGDRGVLVHQHHRHGFSHDVAAPYDHGVPAGDGDSVPLEHLDNTRRRAGPRPRQARHQAAHVAGVDAVRVFIRIERQEHTLAIHLRGQRKLHQQAIDIRSCVQLPHHFQHFLGGGRLGRGEGLGVDPQILARLHLIANVDLRSRIVAHQHDRQARRPAAVRQRGDARPQLVLDLIAHTISVEYSGHLLLQ